MLLLFLIINKAGGLIYQKDLAPSSSILQKRTANEYLVIASAFQSLHAISGQLQHRQDAPLGITKIQTSSFSLSCLNTQTDLKFIVLSSVDEPEKGVASFLQRAYQLYADFVQKDPFQPLEMPIRSGSLFSERLSVP